MNAILDITVSTLRRPSTSFELYGFERVREVWNVGALRDPSEGSRGE